MKIQIVSWRDPENPHAGGAEVCLREIARRLTGRHGHEVAWFASRFPGSAARGLVDAITIERAGRSEAMHVAAARRFFRRSRQDADVFLEDYHGVTLGLSWLLGKPVVVFVHEVAGPIWLEMWRFPVSWVGFALEKLTLRGLRRAHFIAVSPSTLADLVAHGIPRERITLVREGSDLPRRDAPLPRADRESRFVFVGRICQMKRVDLLLRAFAVHLADAPASRLTLVGTLDEAFRPVLERLMRELGIGHAVTLAGRVSQERKAELLATSLALVSCSMREGFGLIVVEANSQGTPALTFDVNGYRDLVVRGENGATVPFPDVRALAAEMTALAARDEAAYDALARSSLAASARYSWDETARDVEAVLQRLAKGDA